MLNYKDIEPGDELEYSNPPIAHFIRDIMENAALLILGERYIVKSIKIASSWTRVALEGFPCEKHGDKIFSLNMFSWPKCSCKNPGTWVYMPETSVCMPESNSENPYYCDSCVPLGCSCNWELQEGIDYDSKEAELPENYYEITDSDGNKLPCCEYWRTKYGEILDISKTK